MSPRHTLVSHGISIFNYKGMRPSLLLPLLSSALPATSQTLLSAISAIPTLSNFTAFYTSNQPFADSLFLNQTQYPITVLIPNDDAFAAYKSENGIALTDLSADLLLPLIQYHTLVSSLSRENLTVQSGGKEGPGSSSGTTIPTLLVGDDKGVGNNRSVGPALSSKFGGAERSRGQVVFISAQSSSPSSKFLLSRQAGPGSSGSVRSGLSQNVNLTALDDAGIWDGGRFHIIDAMLTPPTLCKTTIRQAKLTGLDNALNRSGLWTALDTSPNITCLGPSNSAFDKAGNPDKSLNETELSKALLFHTLPEVTYTDFLVDGREFTSLGNLTVRVRVEEKGEGEEKEKVVWFNNARVVDANVLTHNGLMHVLDGVMEPLEEGTPTTTGTMPSPTAENTPVESSSAAGGWHGTGVGGWAVWEVVGLGVLTGGMWAW